RIETIVLRRHAIGQFFFNCCRFCFRTDHDRGETRRQSLDLRDARGRTLSEILARSYSAGRRSDALFETMKITRARSVAAPLCRGVQDTAAERRDYSPQP